jgi:hypothetical protein
MLLLEKGLREQNYLALAKLAVENFQLGIARNDLVLTR